MTLHFEILESDDGMLAKRARMGHGWIYLFQEREPVPESLLHHRTVAAACCFVPDPPRGVSLSADDLHALSRR